MHLKSSDFDLHALVFAFDAPQSLACVESFGWGIAVGLEHDAVHIQLLLSHGAVCAILACVQCLNRVAFSTKTWANNITKTEMTNSRPNSRLSSPTWLEF